MQFWDGQMGVLIQTIRAHQLDVIALDVAKARYMLAVVDRVHVVVCSRFALLSICFLSCGVISTFLAFHYDGVSGTTEAMKVAQLWYHCCMCLFNRLSSESFWRQLMFLPVCFVLIVHRTARRWCAAAWIRSFRYSASLR